MGNEVSTRRKLDYDPKYHDWDKETAYKILLSGVESSGKTTIFKQTKIVFQDGFDDEELRTYREIINHLLLASFERINEAVEEEDDLVLNSLALNLESSSWKKFKSAMIEFYSKESFSPTLLALMHDKLFADKVIAALLETTKIAFPNYLRSSAYLFQEMPRILSSDYVPSNRDILHAWRKTTGINGTTLLVDELPCRIVDIGGTRSERKKWINFFGSVSTLVCCVPLGDYNKSFGYYTASAEHNQVEESLVLFDALVRVRWFRRTQFILFLPKWTSWRNNCTRYCCLGSILNV
ncbi:guanine nucleotide binding protein, alpha subunit [Gymnopilus junonius]|uniref:Guanine nucleotide binding protein, alpha subunit n=1 Tax=Gymnopilus junonius TaxID=109634 RepID=A0A9P5NIX6_GYMJU|nr:guanine nucleotide binding protein, alpha subunit [Gymnopilus junonius]